MSTSVVRRLAACLLASLLVSVPLASRVEAEPVAVRFSEGLVHGFLKLSAMDGTALAEGDLSQTARGDRVTSHLVFHFQDGSLQEETAVYSQRGQFRMVSDHVKQLGPSFPRPLEMSIDASGQVKVEYTDEHGQKKTETEHLQVPSDLANGMILTLLKNVRPNAVPKELSLIVATPKPRVVKLELQPPVEEPFSTGRTARKAMHYVLKIDIGGLAGVIAPIIGKEPPDSHVWIFTGEAPAFVKSEQTFYMGGPMWRVELDSPRWPRADRSFANRGQSRAIQGGAKRTGSSHK
jgi:hypothetical protein